MWNEKSEERGGGRPIYKWGRSIYKGGKYASVVLNIFILVQLCIKKQFSSFKSRLNLFLEPTTTEQWRYPFWSRKQRDPLMGFRLKVGQISQLQLVLNDTQIKTLSQTLHKEELGEGL